MFFSEQQNIEITGDNVIPRFGYAGKVSKSSSSTHQTNMDQSFSGRGALKVKNKSPAELPTWTGTADMAHALKTDTKSTVPMATWAGTAMGHGLLHS